MSDASSVEPGRSAALPRPRLAVRTATLLLFAALVLGVGGRALFATPALGLNVLAWCGALVLVLGVLARAWRVDVTPEGRTLLALGLVLAAMFAWRDSPLLTFVNASAVLTAFALAAPHVRAEGLRTSSVLQHALSLARGHLVGVTGPLSVAFLAPWREVGRRTFHPSVGPLARGLLIALPILSVFTLLLTSADAVFARLLGDTLRFDSDAAVSSAFAILGWSWLALGWLYGALIADPWTVPTDVPFAPKLGLTEVTVVLGSVALLFGAFIAVQGAYFFGGTSQVTALTGLTYAEYARKGFFELVTVAALVLPMLLGLASSLRSTERRGAVFRALCVVIAVLVAVMLLSATSRMRLYVDAYGLTLDRLLATTFMTWVALTLALFVGTLLTDTLRRFAFLAVLLGFATTIALNVANPAALIARVNLPRALQAPSVTVSGRTFASPDLLHLTTVGADAIRALAPHLPDLPPAVRRDVEARAAHALSAANDVRAWNWSRRAARAAFERTSSAE